MSSDFWLGAAVSAVVLGALHYFEGRAREQLLYLKACLREPLQLFGRDYLIVPDDEH